MHVRYNTIDKIHFIIIIGYFFVWSRPLVAFAVCTRWNRKRQETSPHFDGDGWLRCDAVMSISMVWKHCWEWANEYYRVAQMRVQTQSKTSKTCCILIYFDFCPSVIFSLVFAHCSRRMIETYVHRTHRQSLTCGWFLFLIFFFLNLQFR